MNSFNPVLGENHLPEFISVISASKCARIRIEDIEVIEQEGRKLHVIAADREYCFYESMKEIIMCLYGRAFYRPVKGLIINFNHVKEISGNAVTFHSGHVVTMGKNSITRTRASYKKYLMRYPPYTMVDINPAAMHVAENPLLNEPGMDRKRPYAISEKKHEQKLAQAIDSENRKKQIAGTAEYSACDTDINAGIKPDESQNTESETDLICLNVEPRHIQHVGRRVTYKQAAEESNLPLTR